MEEGSNSSVDFILGFLKKNKFSRAEFSIGRREKNSGLSRNSEANVLDSYTWKLNQSNSGVVADSLHHDGGISAKVKTNLRQGEGVNFVIDEKSFTSSWLRSTSKSISNTKEKENGHSGCSKDDNFVENPWSQNDESTIQLGKEVWKNCSVKTVLQFPTGDVPASYSSVGSGDIKDGKRKLKDTNYVWAATKKQADEVGRVLYLGNEPKTFGSLGIIPYVPSENRKEDFPRLAPVKMKLAEKPLNITWEEKFERDVSSSKIINTDAYLGSFLDVPI